jgi:hypothetical protein
MSITIYDLISVDPGKRLGIALWKDKTLRYCNTFDYSFNAMWQFLLKNPAKHLAIELQYYYNNAKVLMDLVALRAEVTTLYRVCNPMGSIIRVSASEWQKILELGAKAPRRERKQASLAYAEKMTGQIMRSFDTADAVCIGIYTINFLLDKSPKRDIIEN